MLQPASRSLSYLSEIGNSRQSPESYPLPPYSQPPVVVIRRRCTTWRDVITVGVFIFNFFPRLEKLLLYYTNRFLLRGGKDPTPWLKYDEDYPTAPLDSVRVRGQTTLAAAVAAHGAVTRHRRVTDSVPSPCTPRHAVIILIINVTS